MPLRLAFPEQFDLNRTAWDAAEVVTDLVFMFAVILTFFTVRC